MIRPHLEYGNVVWHPRFKKDMNLLENVQHRATRLIPGFRNLSYEERLRRLDLPTLTYRRFRGDAIETYKYLSGLYTSNNASALLPLADTPSGVTTRGHQRKLKKRNCRTCLRSNTFGYRIVNLWNSLPELVVESPTLNIFKSRFDSACRHLRFSTNERDFI